MCFFYKIIRFFKTYVVFLQAEISLFIINKPKKRERIMKKRLTMFMASILLFVGGAFAQTQVNGTVFSEEDQEPIIGATVRIDGVKIGMLTDANGNFSLTMPQGKTKLKISYVGYVPQTVTAKNGMKVYLKPDVTSLDEVVVTAMGIKREKKALGYAAQELKADKLTEAASTSLSSALQGKVSGVEISPSSGMPGASAKITIRGSRSFTGDNTPLYVVDGMPIASTSDIDTQNSVTGTDFANRSVDIDPNDIESINILKGQAASALYGMRASNGVIVITTKSGRGARKGKPEITFSTNLSFEKPSRTPEFQTEFAQGSISKGKAIYSPNASTSWGPRIVDLPNDPTYGGNVANSYTNDGANLHPGQYYVPQRAKAGLDPWATPQSYDNTDEFFQTGMTWSNNVNIAQSFDKGSYSFSLGNMHTDAIIPQTGMNRYNAKLSGEAQLSKNWSTGFSGNYIFSKIQKQPSANNGIVATVYGSPASYDLKGIPSHIENDPYTQNTYRGTGGFDGPYWALDNNNFTERSQRFFGNAFAKYSTKMGTDDMNLDVKYQLGLDSYTTNYDDIWGYGHSNGTGEADLYHYSINEFNSLLTINYTWDINSDFKLNALVGNEYVHKTTKFAESYGSNFNFAGWNHIKNASVYQASGSYYRKRTFGLFGNLSLDYKNMVYLNVTGRNDIVSTMPNGNRSFFYPSVSLGFIFTELEPLKNDILTYGKLRASYAEVGQAGEYLPTYYTTPTYGGGFSSGTPIMYPIKGVVAYAPSSTVYDANLKPQNTKSYEFGIDLAFLNGLVSLSYTYSRQDVKDQIFEVPLSASTGYGSLVTNGGKIHTNAHEITLGLKPFDTPDFKWDMEFNFSKIDNYVDELAPGVESIFLGGFVDPQVRANIGDKFPVIYGTRFLRNENGDIVVDENGLPQPGDEGVIGKVSPDFTLGIGTNIEFKKLRLSAVLDWKKGGQMYCGTMGVLNYYGVTQKSADYRNSEGFLFELPAVKQNADGSYSPNDIIIKGENAFDYFSAMDDVSEAGVYDNGYLKLREISLSYPVLNKSWLNIRANVFARNLILWSALEGLDPEATQGNNNMSGSFERFSLPGASTYGFGLTFKF